MVLSDRTIADMAAHANLIHPFIDQQVKSPERISYGLSSVGYDIRLQPQFKVFRPYRNSPRERILTRLFPSRANAKPVDPLDFDERQVEFTQAFEIILQPGQFALGVAMEKFHMPEDCMALVFNKSTLARSGLMVWPTVFEPGWKGWPTLEFSNLSSRPMVIRSRMGIAQVMFFQADTVPLITYGLGRKYQDQPSEVVTPRPQGWMDQTE